MKKIVLAISIITIMTGCSHNAVTYSDGIGLDTTFNPETYTFGFCFRYGKIFSGVLRENSEVEMSGNGSATGNNSTNATSTSNLKIKIGKQITGYYVDAIRAGATPNDIDSYVNGEQK